MEPKGSSFFWKYMAISNKDKELFDWVTIVYLDSYKTDPTSKVYTYVKAEQDRKAYGLPSCGESWILNTKAVLLSKLLQELLNDQ